MFLLAIDAKTANIFLSKYSHKRRQIRANTNTLMCGSVKHDIGKICSA